VTIAARDYERALSAAISKSYLARGRGSGPGSSSRGSRESGSWTNRATTSRGAARTGARQP